MIAYQTVNRNRIDRRLIAIQDLARHANQIACRALVALELLDRGAEIGALIRFEVPLTGGDRPGLSPAPAISPDGKSIAFPGFTKGGDAVVFIRFLNDLNAKGFDRIRSLFPQGNDLVMAQPGFPLEDLAKFLKVCRRSERALRP